MVGPDIQVTIKVRSQRFGRDLLSIQVQAQIGQVKSLKVERIPVVAPVEGFTADQPNHKLGGSLNQKQIVLHGPQVSCGNGKSSLQHTF